MRETYINTDEIFAKTDSIAKRTEKIGEIFESFDKELKLAQDKQIWLGNTSDVVFLKYEDLKENYEPILASLNRITSFMNMVGRAYIEWDKKMADYAENGDLDINNYKK